MNEEISNKMTPEELQALKDFLASIDPNSQVFNETDKAIKKYESLIKNKNSTNDNKE